MKYFCHTHCHQGAIIGTDTGSPLSSLANSVIAKSIKNFDTRLLYAQICVAYKDNRYYLPSTANHPEKPISDNIMLKLNNNSVAHSNENFYYN
ncbi:unnamed protein product [Callosobruchus maculatus]|uniref:Uncharacterized protein n=1 Tax=Callosobruchus maculatus TaxID=64391 RepID=A0A653BL59_CALMS|nr:unnamed protein product [Callosobruchus maculatus]